jgi:uncharacterized paraquat-inducible protein A
MLALQNHAQHPLDEPRKRPIGYALSALFMLVLANIFPFINMRVATSATKSG